jgi:dTDP-4-dehydrorhamnose reductase
MKLLILGKGYIGTNLKNYLVQEKHEVYNFSRAELDYSSQERLYNFLIKQPVDAVINTSGFTGRPNVDECETKKEQCWKLNVLLPKLIEDTCKEVDANFIHVSSGCIYSGYEKDFTEDDKPNFGMFEDHSSFYSKSKHAGELNLDHNFSNIVRIRMPIEGELTDKNLLTKLLKYNNIIDFRNSKTDITVLCEFIETIADNFQAGIFNAVHGNSLSTKQVVDIMKEFGIENKDWKFVPYDDLDIACNRSNCVLDNTKSKESLDFDWGDEEFYIRKNCELIRKNKKENE